MGLPKQHECDSCKIPFEIGELMLINDLKLCRICLEQYLDQGTITAKPGNMERYGKATRTDSTNKIDPEGFFSPLVVLRYAQYMHKCRKLADGSLRESDNWQGGIPLFRFMKAKWRHFLDTWMIHRGWQEKTEEGLDLEDCLCAELFNTMGYLHELLKAKRKGGEDVAG